MTGPQRVVLVAAVADNGVIGLDGDIPWSIPEDLRHFRAVTRDNTVVMGRRTFESIGHPLPFRTNVVVTRDRDWSRDGVFVAHDVDEAIAMARDFPGDVMVIGGAQIYAAAMPVATHQVLTEVRQRPDGDTTYPAWDRAEWVETEREPHEGFDFVWWERR
jgi:dihydrofolate reductase